MELIFIRHGQGEHTLNSPDSLQIQDPALTKEGVFQAQSLQSQINLNERDIVVISPVRRTLETASILTKDINCRRIVSPLVSPRMFPQNPEWKTLPCDRMLNPKLIREQFPRFTIQEGLSEELWTSGINTMPEQEFNLLAETFLKWCKSQGVEHIYVVSHDGTINSYRQIMRGEKLTRKDFLKDAGWIKQTC
ncbi:histidine phosphatase family protein [Rossellomorea vietnamensis]|uniref:Histidine phosphatase family protein n=2 Tax=Rossellomorea TaxID=2837508 RepID=A0A5D4KC49_9BACI|nr:MULTISPECIES: histidine phosphatase family protein [Rossellomorea]TYR73703.1 histidine phosphatase family protein [Rossellomorea vietnamensis]TYS76989.1 histidine phosphatase family protein [Rossellomorea aquimaris]